MEKPVRHPVTSSEILRQTPLGTIYLDERRKGEEAGYEKHSEHLCASCQDPIDFDTTITLFQGAFTHFNGTEIVYNMILDDDGEPEILPLILHDECWHLLHDALLDLVSDQVPIEEAGTVLSCDICDGTIRMGEKVIVMDLGEMQRSPRTGSPKISFEEYENHFVFCLTCSCNIADITETETWADLNQHGECYHCTKAHCWRAGRCGCECHVA